MGGASTAHGCCQACAYEKIVHWDIEDPVYVINDLEKSDKPNREELISIEIHKTYSNLETRINDWIKNYEK